MSLAAFGPAAAAAAAVAVRVMMFTPGYNSPLQEGASGIGLSGNRRTD